MTPIHSIFVGIHLNMHDAIQKALTEQATIGWRLALKGSLSKEWVRVASYEMYDCQVTKLTKSSKRIRLLLKELYIHQLSHAQLRDCPHPLK